MTGSASHAMTLFDDRAAAIRVGGLEEEKGKKFSRGEVGAKGGG